MQKLKLKAIELAADEVLTRSQLKNILGGSDDCLNAPPQSRCQGFHPGCCPGHSVCVSSSFGYQCF